MSSVKIQGSATGTAAFTIAVPDGTSTDRTIELPDAAGSFVLADGSNNVAITGDLTVDTDTLYVDSANNRVGIGITSPTSRLQLDGAEDRTGGLTLSAGGQNHTYFLSSDFVNVHNIETSSTSAAHTWQTNGTERARIDGSGNLLVGTTQTFPAFNNVVGCEVGGFGQISASRDGAEAMQLNRKTSDGNIALFKKDGTTVGSIGTYSSGLDIAGSSRGVRFSGSTIFPVTNAGGVSDNSVQLGYSGGRFKDAFIVNGVTTGSDANEKQQIAVLTDAEIAAAKRISAGFKTFKWNDAVEAKGDNARTHTGVIAQEVQAALEAEGLDAGNYAFWMSDTWWETQTEVPAVEAVDEVIDEDGNVVTEAVEAQEAYTRTDTYTTAEEAPEGATERTRLGIRYPELLAFIGAATEQRLASIEARLDALEAV